MTPVSPWPCWSTAIFFKLPRLLAPAPHRPHPCHAPPHRALGPYFSTNKIHSLPGLNRSSPRSSAPAHAPDTHPTPGPDLWHDHSDLTVTTLQSEVVWTEFHYTLYQLLCCKTSGTQKHVVGRDFLHLDNVRLSKNLFTRTRIRP